MANASLGPSTKRPAEEILGFTASLLLVDSEWALLNWRSRFADTRLLSNFSCFSAGFDKHESSGLLCMCSGTQTNQVASDLYNQASTLTISIHVIGRETLITAGFVDHVTSDYAKSLILQRTTRFRHPVLSAIHLLAIEVPVSYGYGVQ